MELAHPLEPAGDDSPLALARLHRQLTVEEAARRASISTEEVRWLEEGRVYRFPSPDDALLATLLYATALGVDQREARELAGLPVTIQDPQRLPRARLLVLGAILTALAVLAAVAIVPRAGGNGATRDKRATVALPPPWRIPVTVLNGSGDINYTRRVASRIGALAYRIQKVSRANRFDYPQTAVYYAPGGESLALRLAKQLGVVTKPLPGGSDARHLYVIVGPARGPGE